MSQEAVKKQLESFAPSLTWEKVEEKGDKDIWEASRRGITVRVEIPYSDNNPFISMAAMRAERMIDQEEQNAKG